MSDAPAPAPARGFDYEAVKDLLACPVCRAELVHPDAASLVCCDPETRLRYPVRDGIPDLLPDSGEALSRDEWADIMKSQSRDPKTGEKAAP